MLVRRFCQNAEFFHLQADVPSFFAVGRLDDDGVQETFTTNLFDERAVDFAHFIAEDLSEISGAFSEFFFFNDFEGSDTYAASDMVATECGAVFARFDVEHDVVVAKNGGNRHCTTGEGFAEDEDVRTNAFVVAS